MVIHRGKAAIAFISGQFLGDEANVVCPNCECDYTHIQHVGTLVGSDELEAVAAYDGTEPSGATPQRRSAVEIVFSCEGCPERFALVIQQSKGNNLVEIHVGIRSPSE